MSVIIPFNNRVHWLRPAIQSVLDQTLGDFELIVVDDASAEPLDSLPLDDDRVRYIRRSENRGVGAARNLGMDLARGEYVTFLDSDDVFLPGKLEAQVGFMSRNRDVPFTYTSYQYMTAEGEPLGEVRIGAHSRLRYPDILLSCPVSTSTVMIRRHSNMGELRFEEGVHGGEDIPLWARVARIGALVGIDEVLTLVRNHDDTVRTNTGAMIQAHVNLMNSSMVRNSPVASACRRNVLSLIYLRGPTRSWRALGADDLWKLDAAGLEVGDAEGSRQLRRVPDDPAAGKESGDARLDPARAAALIAERDAIVRDLHWTLDEVIGRLVEREQTIARLDREIAELQRAVTKRDKVLAPLGVLALYRLLCRLRAASGRLRSTRRIQAMLARLEALVPRLRLVRRAVVGRNEDSRCGS